MKVVQPLALQLMPRPVMVGGEPKLCVSAFSFFRLGAIEELLPAHAYIGKAYAAAPAGQALDALLPKGEPEVLVFGQAQPAQKTARMAVTMQLGPVEKRLRVLGLRAFRPLALSGYEVDEPAMFEAISLGWDGAYGGKGYAPNPGGKGHVEDSLFADSEGTMPNIEHWNEHLRPGSRPRAPAGFSMLAPFGEESRSLLGTFDDRWLANEAPGLPANVDWQAFNVAPNDQRFPGYKGVSAWEYRLEGFHRDAPCIRGRLPLRRLRLFVQSGAADFCPVDAHVDTVCLFPTDGFGVLIYRGMTPITDSDGLDVRAVLGALERERARPDAEYREVLRQRMLPASISRLHAFDDSLLLPLEEVVAVAEVPSDKPGLLGKLEEMRAAAAPADGGPPQIGRFAQKAEAALDAARAQADQRLKDASALLTNLSKAPASSDSAPVDSAASTQRAVQEAVAAAEKQSGDAPSAPGAAMTEVLMRRARLLAPAPTAPRPPDEVGWALAECVRRLLRQGQSLAGRNFTGVLLEDLDLRGQDLSGAIFEHARVINCDFQGANLSGASFCGAELQSVTFDGAELDEANFSAARLSGVAASSASLVGSAWKGAKLDRCFWLSCNFAGTHLTEVSATGCSWAGSVFARGSVLSADLTECSFDQVKMSHVPIAGCRLRNVSFDGAELAFVSFADARAVDVSFDGAAWTKSIVIRGSQFVGASFRKARIHHSGFRGATLDVTDFSGAALTEVDMAEAELDGACFVDALVVRGGFVQASLRGADLTRAELYQVILRKATLEAAILRDASLVGCDMTGGRIDYAVLEGCKPDPTRGPLKGKVAA
jgi:uncharacterized protein YjbI with pentapeptide repeats